MQNGLKAEKYLGIDIVEAAIRTASLQFPAATFRQLDFEKVSLKDKFDVIIFNESLYYLRGR